MAKPPRFRDWKRFGSTQKPSLAAAPDRIQVRGLVPEDGEAVLCYHWVPTLRCEPPTRLEPVLLADDPSPFIRLVDPPADVEIRTGP